MTVVHSARPWPRETSMPQSRYCACAGCGCPAPAGSCSRRCTRAQGPISAETIAGGLGRAAPRSDLASVYRNLETLERVGLVSHVHLGHGPGLYGLATAAEREFVTCERCGTARAFDPADLAEAASRSAARRATSRRFSHFPIVGLCAGCAQEGASAATARAERVRVG